MLKKVQAWNKVKASSAALSSSAGSNATKSETEPDTLRTLCQPVFTEDDAPIDSLREISPTTKSLEDFLNLKFHG